MEPGEWIIGKETEGHQEGTNVSGAGRMDIGKGSVLEGIQFATHVAWRGIWRRGAIKGLGSNRETPGVGNGMGDNNRILVAAR